MNFLCLRKVKNLLHKSLYSEFFRNSDFLTFQHFVTHVFNPLSTKSKFSKWTPFD